MTLSIFSVRGQVGSARVCVEERILDYTILVSPRVRLSHAAAVGMMEHGESLLSTFVGAAIQRDGVDVPINVIAGTFALPRNGDPDITEWIAVIPGKDNVKLSTLLSRGMRLLSTLTADG